MAKKDELDFEDVLELEGTVENPSQEEEQGLVIQLAVGIKGTINDNLDKAEVEILREVKNAIEQAKTGDIAKAKKVVSYANNQIKDLNQKRISVKNEWMKPLDEIANRIKAIEKKVNEATEPLVKEILIQEEKELKAKVELIKKLKDARIDQEVLSTAKFIHACRWFDNSSWTNKGYTEPKITKEIDAKVLEIVGNLEALDLIGDGNKNSSAVSLKYQEAGNLSQAISYRKQLEEADRQEEERKAKAVKEREERLAKEQQEKEEREERLAIQEVARKERLAQEEEAKAFEEAQNVPEEPVAEYGTTEVPKFMQETPVEPVVPTAPSEQVATTPAEPVTNDYTLTIRCQKDFLLKLGQFMRDNDCKYKLEAK